MFRLSSRHLLAPAALGVAVGSLLVGQTALAQVQPTTAPFATFTVTGEKELDDAELEIDGVFTLSGANNGINPLSEVIQVSIGPFATTIPAGSFLADNDGEWEFEQIINNVAWDVEIEPGRTGSFEFDVDLEGINLNSVGNSVTVRLVIGNDSGQTTISHLRVDQD